MNIYVDWDGVVQDTIEGMIPYLNNDLKMNLKKEDFHTLWWTGVFKKSKEETQKIYYDFYQTPYFSKIPFIDGAIDGIKKLSKEHALILVSSRQQYLREYTKYLIEQNFSEAIKKIRFTGNLQDPFSPYIITKEQVCIEEKIDIAIEDDIDYVKKISPLIKKVLLFNQPWNQTNTLPDNVKRVYNWNEVLENI